MDFYYQVLLYLYGLKSAEMRKIKILKYELKDCLFHKKCKGLKSVLHELSYQRCSINLINKIIRSVKRISGRVELEEFEKQEENEETFEET